MKFYLIDQYDKMADKEKTTTEGNLYKAAPSWTKQSSDRTTFLCFVQSTGHVVQYVFCPICLTNPRFIKQI